MRRVGLGLLLLALVASGAQKKRRALEILVVETAVRRGEGIITVDGKVRNTGERPIQGLTLLFDFLAPGRQVMTTQKIQMEEPVLAPGQEAVYRGALTDPVRSVRYRFHAADEAGRDVRVDNGGPFSIE